MSADEEFIHASKERHCADDDWCLNRNRPCEYHAGYIDAVHELLALPVEQRMEAMGMRPADWRDAATPQVPIWTVA
jgi:hypothetical protein